MTRHQKIVIDRVFGVILNVLLFVPTLILEKALRRNHVLPPDGFVETIVVAKYIGIGSILQATPMLAELKKAYPTTELIFITSKPNYDLVSGIEYVDRVLIIDDSAASRFISSLARLLWVLVPKRVDVFINLEVHSNFGSLVALLSCAKNRIGFSTSNLSFKSFYFTHLLYFNALMPISVCYLQAAKVAGVKPPSRYNGLLRPKFDAFQRGSTPDLPAALACAGARIVAINVNASDLRFERRWPLDRFAAVARYLAEKGYSVALVGSSQEAEYVEKLFDFLPHRNFSIYNLAGLFDLSGLFDFLEGCNLIVTNDSGIMNVGLTLDVPLLLLAGPVSPEQYFFVDKKRTYLYGRPYCSPCTHRLDQAPCGGDNVCMQLISVEVVCEAVDALIAGNDYFPREIKNSSDYSYVEGLIMDRGKS